MPLMRSAWWMVAVACLIAFATSRANALQTWTEVRSPHFRVLTDSSPDDGRKVAFEFEQMRHVFAVRLHDEAIEARPPLTIIAAHDDNTVKALEPHMWKESHGNYAGEFHRGRDKQFAIIRLDTWGDSNSTVVYHEYTHSVFHSLVRWLPIWLDEGFAEFYGFTWFRSDKTLLGAPSPSLGDLKNHTLWPITKMFEMTDEGKLFGDETATYVFYAESWALVHYLTFGAEMNGGAKLATFIQRLQNGDDQTKAFQDIFGDFKKFDEQFRQYTMRNSFAAGAIAPDKTVAAKSFEARKLGPAETQYELGAYRIGAGEMETGRASIEKAIALDPKLAGAHEEMGFLQFDAGKDAEAKTEWDEALKLDPNRWRSLFAETMAGFGTDLQRGSKEELEGVLAKLNHVSELAPKYAPAYAEEALLEWQLKSMQKAFVDARAAETINPWLAGYRILSGRILLVGGQPAMAATYARFAADHWKGPDHNEAVDLLHQVPVAQQGTAPLPAFDTPMGATVLRGTIQDVTCSDKPNTRSTMTLLPDSPAGAKPVTLKMANRFMAGYSDTLWFGGDHFSMCHHLVGYPVVIASKPEAGAPDAVIVDVEIRDHLPTFVGQVAVVGKP